MRIQSSLTDLKAKVEESGMVYRDGTSAEGATHSVSYIPHMVIVDGEGKSLKAYDSSELGALHENGTLADTVHDAALSYNK